MSPERARAFLDDYAWMIDTGESPATAATRFGCTLNTLQRRLDRAREVVSDQAGITGKNATIDPISGPTRTAPNRWWNTVSEPRQLHPLTYQEAQ